MQNNIYQRMASGRMTRKDFIKTGLGLVGLVLFSGCDNGGSGGGSSYAGASIPFAINSPASGAVVNSDIISINGTGIKKEVASFLVSVHTNDWYDQTGSFHLEEDGEWFYSPVNLCGSGIYNDHIIRANVVYVDGKTESASVNGIVRA
jgi:DNA-directed RNA polymerase subunit E'/Rpb7